MLQQRTFNMCAHAIHFFLILFVKITSSFPSPEDLDQHFSRLTAYIRHHLREAETLCDFEKCMLAFSARANRPHEKNYYVKRVDQVRNWKQHLASMNRHLRGIGGTKAPKVFQFTKVKRATAFQLRDPDFDDF